MDADLTEPSTEPDKNRPTFEETQWCPSWVWVLLVPAALLAVVVAVRGLLYEHDPAYLLLICVLLLTFNLLCVRTRVNEQQISVTFGAVFPLYRRRIRLQDVTSAQTVTYNPIGEYGGWGIRGEKGNQCLSARGNEGVRLTLASDETLLVGSARPDALAAVLLPLS